MRKSTKFSLSIFFIILLFFIALPSLISTPIGTRAFTSFVNLFLDGNLQVEKVTLRWFGTQEFSNLLYKDQEDRKVITINEGKAEHSFLPFGKLGDVVIKELVITLYQDELTDKSKIPLPYFLLRSPLHLENGRVVIQPEQGIPSTIQNIQLAFDPHQQHFSLQAEGIDGIHKGTITAKGTCCDPLHVEATITNFPLTLLTAFEELRWLPSALGRELSATLLLNQIEGAAPQLTATINSSYLQGTIQGVKEGDFFAILPESKLQWQLTPSIFQEAFSLSEESPFFLADKVSVIIEPKKILIPLHDRRDFINDLQLSAHLTAESLTLIYKDKGYLISQLDGSLIKEKDSQFTLIYQGKLYNKYGTTVQGTLTYQNQGNSCLTAQIDQLPSIILEDLSGLHGALTPYGERVALNVEAIKKNNKINATVTIHAELAHLLLKTEGKLGGELTFSVTGELIFQGDKKEFFGEKLALELRGVTLMKQGVFNFATLEGYAENPHLHVKITGNVGNPNLPFSWDLVDVVIQGTIQPSPLFGLEQKPHPLYLHLEGGDNEILFKVDLSLLKIEGSLHNFIQGNTLTFSQAEWHLTAQGDEMPLVFIKKLYPSLSILCDLLAPHLTFQAEITHQPSIEPHTSLNIDAHAEGFTLSGMATLNGNLKVSQEKPIHLSYEINPERMAALLRHFPHQPIFHLATISVLDFTISSFTCPTQYPGNIKEFLCRSGFSGALTLSPLHFVNENGQQQFAIENIQGKLSGENFSQAITFNLDTLLVAQQQTSPMKLSGNLFYLFTEKGEWNRDFSEFKSEFSLDSFPTEMLLGILPMEGTTREIGEALLGERVSALAHIDIKRKEGPIQLSIQASNFKATCPFYLKSSTLFLTEALDAEIVLTHKINEALIKDINPILISGIYSNHPLRLKIQHESFSLPLFPLTFRGIRIASAVLDIGKIEVVYGGQIEKIMEFVKSQQRSDSGVMSAWFTPIYFALTEGNLNYERFDLMLAGNVHLAFWGKIDLIKDKVHMMMAIGPETLQRSFGIKGLTSKEMFHVKMRGSTSNVELDWSAAKRRMGVIIAAAAGGPIGSLVGSLLEKIVTSLGDSPSPPPTTQPFPWE